MGSIFDLPPELRALTTHLSYDDRPSAIIYGSNEIAYQNAAFRDLALTAHEVQLALGHVREAKGLKINVRESVLAGSDGWRQAEVLDGWKTLVKLGGHGQPLASDTHLQSPEQDDAFDWTRYEIPDLSPWLCYVRDFDWSSTHLGPMSSWDPLLRSVMLHVQSNPQPRALLLGHSPRDQIFIYNEACIPLFDGLSRFGRLVREAWADLYEGIRLEIEAATRGKPMTLLELPIIMERAGRVEETFFDSTLLPIAGEDGRVIGLLDELIEITQTVRGKHRRRSILAISTQIAKASTLSELWPAFVAGLETAVEDVSYAILYSVRTDRDNCAAATAENLVLEGRIGLPVDSPSFLDVCLQAWRCGDVVTLRSEDGTLPPAVNVLESHRAFGSEVVQAKVAPITSAVGNEILAVLVVGLNPRRPYDDEFSIWVTLIADLLRKTATLIQLPEEQRRAQQLSNELNDSLVEQLRTTTQQAERNEAKFQRMAESAPQGMYMFDSEGRTLHVNDRYLAIVGQTREQHTTRDAWKDQVHEDDLEKFSEAWHTLLQKKPVTIEYRLKRRWHSVDDRTGDNLDNETWLLANAFPDIGADGKVVNVMGWLTDISHQKLADKLQAQRLNEALENKRQSENFIDMTSHEMRNPLSAILQSADSIVHTLTTIGMPILGENMSLSPDTADEIIDAAQTVILCAQHQKRIVDDILTLSKLDASLLLISPDKVQPPVLVKKALEMYKSELVHADIETTLCVEQSYKDLGVDWIVLDPSRLLQVIINLLTNAIKFTQYAKVRNITVCLGASLERPTGQHHHVKFIPVRSPAFSVHCIRPR